MHEDVPTSWLGTRRPEEGREQGKRRSPYVCLGQTRRHDVLLLYGRSDPHGRGYYLCCRNQQGHLEQDRDNRFPPPRLGSRSVSSFHWTLGQQSLLPEHQELHF